MKGKTTSRIRGTTPAVEHAAREMRREMTQAESNLWDALKRKQLAGYRFRSQHPVGRFVLDFCCPERKLVVEVDGEVHKAQTAMDEARTERLQAYGYRVLRFKNEEILNALPNVLERIKQALEGPPIPPIL